MPYWQAATVHMTVDKGGIVVVCDKCAQNLTPPMQNLTLKGVNRIAKQHRCTK